MFLGPAMSRPPMDHGLAKSGLFDYGFIGEFYGIYGDLRRAVRAAGVQYLGEGPATGIRVTIRGPRELRHWLGKA